MPSGRGIMATFNGIQIVNIYMPAREPAGKRRGKIFFNVDIPRLLTHPATTMLFVGDFNCTLQNTDCTGTPSTSRALRNLIAGMHLHDTWNASTETRTYTHYTVTGATRLDRIYVTDDLLRKKKSIEIRAAAFTDHLAVISHTKCPMDTTMGQGSWRLNMMLLRDRYTVDPLKDEWTKWKGSKERYPSPVIWWCRHVKPKIQAFFRRRVSGRKQEFRNKENFYYHALYDLLDDEKNHPTKGANVRMIKAKIIRLHAEYRILSDILGRQQIRHTGHCQGNVHEREHTDPTKTRTSNLHTKIGTCQSSRRLSPTDTSQRL
jgi:hypothetical protein